jgi:ABC-type methionine transport system ATPase subunit
MKLLKEINEKENITMLIVTHSTEILTQFPSKVLVIEEGKVKEA